MNTIILTITLLITTEVVAAQSSFIGTWEGKLNAGIELRLIFRIAQSDSGGFAGQLDCPDQGLKDVKASKLWVTADSMIFGIDQFRATYRGKLENDSTVTGVFFQGVSIPLKFKKITKVHEIVRTQTPVGPFPYRVEELEYTNNDKSISYGATLTMPNGPGPFPAVLLLTGSGQQNRDEEVAAHKPFAVIADHLTRNGFAVLRVDDRGMGKTTGDPRSSTSRDFADDAIVSLNYLKSRKEVNQKRIGLIGHSEGGMLAQMIAAERKDITFVVMLAAPGIPVKKILHEQNEAILLKSGLPKDYVTAYLELYQSIIDTSTSSDDKMRHADIQRVVDMWISRTPAHIVRATTGITDESSKANFVNAFAGQVASPWFRYFVSYDPAPNLKKLNAHVLAINGSEDVQVAPDSNLSGIETALRTGKSKYTVRKLPGLNHLFQECKTCTIAEYAKLDQTISPTLLNTMSEWLTATLK
jgi:uncharacterized protein